MLAVLGARAMAQGFAGLGSDADGYTLPAPAASFQFPADHGPHPDFRIEWWYVTANLTAADGTAYGVQWTLFRSALVPRAAPGWASRQIWFAHAGLTTADRQFAAQRRARGGIGQAGVTPSPFAAWIDDWQLAGTDDLARLQMTARGDDFAYDLTLTADGPLVLHGDGGYSLKSPRGQASYYYSQPGYRVSGVLHLPGGPVQVTGQAWLDREWSSQPLAPTQTGWDWVSLHLEDGAKLMVYRLRDSAAPDFVPATYVAPGGGARALPAGVVALVPLHTSRVAGRRIPTAWRVTWPEGGVDLRLDALNPQSWMDTAPPYWEGPVQISGSHRGAGYLEMTGYD
ncbi:MAG: iron ABC transporter permease [Rhodobacteraceae bacterium]|nr:iron ABC transporter permease [Paracoccaceae bacterium]